MLILSLSFIIFLSLYSNMLKIYFSLVTGKCDLQKSNLEGFSGFFFIPK